MNKTDIVQLAVVLHRFVSTALAQVLYVQSMQFVAVTLASRAVEGKLVLGCVPIVCVRVSPGIIASDP